MNLNWLPLICVNFFIHMVPFILRLKKLVEKKNEPPSISKNANTSIVIVHYYLMLVIFRYDSMTGSASHIT